MNYVRWSVLPRALKVAMCSSMSSGCLGRGCHTRPSTSCLRQMHGISEGFTETVNRYWLVARFTYRERGETRPRCESQQVSLQIRFITSASQDRVNGSESQFQKDQSQYFFFIIVSFVCVSFQPYHSNHLQTVFAHFLFLCFLSHVFISLIFPAFASFQR